VLGFAAVNKDELLQMVRFGAEMVFSSKDSTITDEDIDRIIAKGEEATAELDAKMKRFTEDAIKFKMDDSECDNYDLTFYISVMPGYEMESESEIELPLF
jgi:hypothetical protein